MNGISQREGSVSGQAVIKQEQESTPVSETGSIIHMIERVALDPTVDITRLERLMDMHERIIARNARAAYDAALSAMQPELPIVKERGKIEIREKDNKGARTGAITQSTSYALWEDINEAIGPVLAKHGFAISFRTGLHADGRITVTGILSHRDGHREETMMTLPHDSSGSKNAVQAVGSSTSYGKRYTACALLNISSRGEDDDGKAGGDDEHISEEQVAEITKLIKDTGGDVVKFCKFAKIENLGDIFAGRYEAAVAAVKQAGEDRKKAKVS
jgi:hypothetical protein